MTEMKIAMMTMKTAIILIVTMTTIAKIDRILRSQYYHFSRYIRV